MKEDWIENAILIGIVIFMVMFTYAVIDTAQAHKSIDTHQPRPQYRDVPECNKELWLRVKDGCSDVLPS